MNDTFLLNFLLLQDAEDVGEDYEDNLQDGQNQQLATQSNEVTKGSPVKRKPSKTNRKVPRHRIC